MNASVVMKLPRCSAICPKRRHLALAWWASMVLLSGASLAAQDHSLTAQSLSRGRGFDEQGGEAIYESVCAACHQRDSEGAVGAASYPALARNENIASTDYMESVLFGGLRGMPPLGQMMSDEQVADVINYVRTHFGNSYGGAVSAAEIATARSQGQRNR
jgi:mono/diheme cytochrome c family protein